MRMDIRNLSFSYGSSKVLGNVTFSVRDGEFVGIMGPNGSGKTTLLRCMTRYLPADGGSIMVDARPLADMSPREVARVFAVVPQSSATDFPFKVEDIVMMGRIPHISSRLAGRAKKDSEAVHRAMERTNTLQFSDRPFTALSGGERQRVIIARALAQEPKVLLLDEPTVYLDVSGQFEVMDLIKRLNKEQSMTIIAVLHDINMAARYCDSIALLNQGRLEAYGPPNEVLTADAIQSVYGMDVSVRRDPFTHAVYVMRRPSSTSGRRHGTRVHVLCGGGTGGPLMRLLLDGGYSVSTGVLNVLDSDFENASDLRIPVLAEAPFAQISEGMHAENLRLVDESSVVVVAPFPVGPGNFRNLEAVEHALRSGKKVFLLAPPQGETIDFIGGKADEYIKRLISSGAIPVKDAQEMLDMISRQER